MSISDIQECLKPWMRVDTWHTGHPNDEERFHLALQQCFQRAGQAIDSDTLRDAMADLAERLHPKLESKYLASMIEKYAVNGEIISSYLFDIGEFNH